MLESARKKFRGFHVKGSAVDVLRANLRSHATFDWHKDSWKRQTALVACLGFVRNFDQFRIGPPAICPSMINIRKGSPTWMAARPAPSASSIVSVMSATNVASAPPNSVTGSEDSRSLGSGKRRMVRRAIRRKMSGGALCSNLPVLRKRKAAADRQRNASQRAPTHDANAAAW
jgi:hypothetical protein